MKIDVADSSAMAIAAFILTCLATLALLSKFLVDRSRRSSSLLRPPAVPGLPLIGNLHQLKEKKPHLTFARWSEEYGPIYTIRTGASTVAVLNSTEVAKEAMVKRFSSISTRKLPKALTLLTSNKAMVAMSDHGQFHKAAKRCILTSVLGSNALKRHRRHRDTMFENISNDLHALIKNDPDGAVSIRELFVAQIFSLSLKQAIGEDVESIYVEDLGTEMSRIEMFNVLVTDPMKGAIEVDWRDFFPYLSWIPNNTTEMKIQRIAKRKIAVTKSLIDAQRKRVSSGEGIDCYLDFLLSGDNNTHFTDEQVISLVWESIIEAVDTTLATTEWAMFELSKNQNCQDRLYHEILSICGTEKMTEEHLPKLPYLSAVFHETLRLYSPVPIIPLRYAHEDTQIAGYHIPAGTQIAINLYACNLDRNIWEEPEKWKPERFLKAKYENLDVHKTMAFGSGKRACAGSLQAMLISCVGVGRFIQEFHWELKEGEKDNKDTVLLTTHKLHPLQAYLKPREVILENNI